jgi:hypothetical protein
MPTREIDFSRRKILKGETQLVEYGLTCKAKKKLIVKI